MSNKPTYEELEQRVKELEQEAIMRKQEEEKLNESQTPLEAAIDQSPSGIMA